MLRFILKSYQQSGPDSAKPVYTTVDVYDLIQIEARLTNYELVGVEQRLDPPREKGGEG